MVQCPDDLLDRSFAALSDATRRGILGRLASAIASITELADQFEITLTGMRKHVDVLERAGLVATEKVGRVRTCRLGPIGLDAEAAWIDRHRRMWDARFAGLEAVVDDLMKRELIDERGQGREGLDGG